ncbi:MAG TPA: hypothetical protein VKB50_18170, partial [Vicinamibacterales bacterium]|nr:hypothetical protein [Vicinamibacterales bacterium]
IEIPNKEFRLKPGMYARVGITTDVKKEALVVPVNAVVDLGGRRGVFQPQGDSAVFHSVQVGTEQRELIEVLGGLAEGDLVVTTGAGALRDGDRVLINGRTGGRGRRGGDAATTGSAPPSGDASQGGGQRPTGLRESGSPRQGGFPGRENATDGKSRENATDGKNATDGRSGSRDGSAGRESHPSGGDAGKRYGGDGTGRRSGGAQRPPSPSSQE